MAKKVSKETKDLILKLSSEGNNSKIIGGIVGLSHKTVLRFLKSEGKNVRNVQVFKIEKFCEFCSKSFITKRSSGKRFCNASCSAKKSNLERFPNHILKKEKALAEEELYKRLYPEYEALTPSQKIKFLRVKSLMSADFNSLGWDRKRERVILEQENFCNRCKLDKWLGVSISLEVDHIDGDRFNNDRSNLEALCPNCHSLTETWRGRNKSIRVESRPVITQRIL